MMTTEPFRIIEGDALTVLRTLPAESVNCCVTSPPYWGLRDYGTAGQIGLEKMPEEYVARMVEVFREVRRVLRLDGTLWLNLGDSYASGMRSAYDDDRHKYQTARPHDQRPATPANLKPKDLIGIPWRVAFALQADGWWLRSDIVWCKGNGMPESVKDRPTRAHEYIFLLSKSERYYYDAAAVAEPVKADTPARYKRGRSGDHKFADGGPGGQTLARTFDHMKQDGHGGRHAGFNDREFARDPGEVRNLRSWWLVNTLPTPEAHFATMPITLAERCVQAGCPEGGTVLDPFAGAGTTGLACLKHGRNFLGIELNPEYIQISEQRAERHMPLLRRAI